MVKMIAAKRYNCSKQLSHKQPLDSQSAFINKKNASLFFLISNISTNICVQNVVVGLFMKTTNLPKTRDFDFIYLLKHNN